MTAHGDLTMRPGWDETALEVAHAAASTGTGAGGDQQRIDTNELEERWKELPDKYLMIIAQFLSGHINDSDAYERFNGPILKASIKSVYWIFLIQYSLLAMLGIVLNVAILAYIMYHKLYKDVTHAFIANLALCHFVQCSVVLPITLMVMLVQNWVYGQFLCFFLPMLQDIPLHVAMISHILIAWDRMRWLGDPLQGRLPAFVCCCATWLTGMVIALPYPIYTIYVEIGDYVPRLDGIGLCVVNLMDDMHEYMRGLFVIMYCAPTVLLAYLYIRTSQELRPPDGPFAVMMFEHRADIRNRQRNSSASSVDRSYSAATTATMGNASSGLATATTTTTATKTSTLGTTKTSRTSTNGHSTTLSATSRSYDLYNAELDVCREKRKQRNLGSMAAAQVVCLCPLMILRLARMVMEETYDNTKHFDFTFLMFVWIAFLPTVIFPCIYGSQILPRTEQERLRGYFRLSSKRLKKSRSGGDSGHSPDSREDSIEKDENTNTTHATSILDGIGIGAGDDYVGRLDKYAHHSNCSSSSNSNALRQGRHEKPPSKTGRGNGCGSGSAKGERGERGGPGVAGVAGGGGKRDGVKINIISENSAKLGGAAAAATATGGRAAKSLKTPMAANGARTAGGPAPGGGVGQRKLTIESVDDHSFSNLTSSTYCNGNSSLLDGDGDVSNFGDGEDSSIVSGMIVQAAGNGQLGGGGGGGAAYYDHLLRGQAPSLRGHKDQETCLEPGFPRMDSSSTLERDLEIIDLLERERSMDIQEMIERERRGEPVRLSGERRRLPDIGWIYKTPKTSLDSASVAASASAYCSSSPSGLSRTASTASAKDTIHMIGDAPSTPSSSLSGTHEAYSVDTASSRLDGKLRDLDRDAEDVGDEEVPPDFFDKYTPGGATVLTATGPITPPPPPPGTTKYQYSRRLSRKSSHHSLPQGSGQSHRASKRDSFNSLNGGDLIAGAFGELDPTQPLTKMSVIESRMRRSSGRTSSFSSSGRSSLKSRDYSGHGSGHSAHPELDFRENIFAEL